MAFNRYEILNSHYTKQIEQLEFDKIKTEAKKNCSVNEDGDTIIASYWLGTTMGVMPSGKIYACWTTNQTRSDVAHDQAFTEALEEVAEKNGMFVDYQDDSIFLSMAVEFNEVIQFVTQDDADLAQEMQEQ